MTTYTVSQSDLDALNVMIDVGGHIPSEVSDALEKVQEGIAEEDTAKAKRYLNKAIKANIKNGEAYSAIQVWHDTVAGQQPPVEPPTQPPTQPGGSWTPIGPALYQGPAKPVNSGNWKVQMVKGNYYTYQPAGDANTCSFSAPGGFCAVAVGDVPGGINTPPGPQPGGMDSSGIVACKHGQWITMWLLDGSDVRNADYSCNNLG